MRWLLADKVVEIFGGILPVAGAGLLDDIVQCFEGFGRQFAVIPELFQLAFGVIDQFCPA
jgi:hypothetical protein